MVGWRYQAPKGTKDSHDLIVLERDKKGQGFYFFELKLFQVWKGKGLPLNEKKLTNKSTAIWVFCFCPILSYYYYCYCDCYLSTLVKVCLLSQLFCMLNFTSLFWSRLWLVVALLIKCLVIKMPFCVGQLRI